jgi:hypothetical protein
MDILKIVGIIAIVGLILSFFQKNFNIFEKISSITGFFAKIFFPSSQSNQMFFIEIHSSNFLINSENLEIELYGKISSLLLNKVSFKFLDNSKIELKLNGMVEKKGSSIKVIGNVLKGKINDEYEFSNAEIILSMEGRIERMVVTSSNKVELSFDRAEIKITKDKETISFTLENSKITAKNVLSLEYLDENITIYSLELETPFKL